MDQPARCERIKPALLELLMDEISPQDRRDVELHLKSCHTCSEDLSELRRTMSLVAQAETTEEIPRHIRMVAEPVNRWAAFWRNPARLAFASAGLMCVAIAVLALSRTTVTYQHGNFEIAFGGRPNSSVAAAPVAPTTKDVAFSGEQPLTATQVNQLVAQAIAAADRDRQRDQQVLAQQVSQRMEQRWQHDLSEMAGSIRYFQAAQTMLYKGQVQNEQLVSALMRQSPTPAPQQQQ